MKKWKQMVILMVMSDEEIDAEIRMVRNKIKTTTSHIGRIELEHRLSQLIEMKKTARNKESWEM